MYNSTDIAKKIKKQAKDNGLILKEIFFSLGLNKNVLTNMYSGSMPTADNLAKIADALNCSVDYLLGRQSLPSDLSSHEKKVITAYINRPDMQPAVDRLLDISDDRENNIQYIAARGYNSKGGGTVSINRSDIKKLQEAPDTEKDL